MEKSDTNMLSLLLQGAPEVLHTHVLPLLDPTDLAMFARVDRTCRATAVETGLPRAGTSAEQPFIVKKFVGSVERLSWGKRNGMPWTAKTCEQIAFWCWRSVSSYEDVQ